MLLRDSAFNCLHWPETKVTCSVSVITAAIARVSYKNCWRGKGCRKRCSMMRFLLLLSIAILPCCAPARPTRAELIEEAREACIKGYAQHSSNSPSAKYAASGKSSPLTDNEMKEKRIIMTLSIDPYDPIFKCFNGFVTKDGYTIQLITFASGNGVSE